jgi:CDP-diacylglycerol--glycerol-3-phosphate 3-phosphatidyltransferase
MARIPWLLIAFRLLLGPLTVLAALNGVRGFWLAAALGAGIFSDIIDGRLARRIGSFEQRLRIADSWVDTAFFLCMAGTAWVAHGDVLRAHGGMLTLMFGLYALSLIVPYIKFKRMPAYHAYSAKAAGLALLAAGAWLFFTGQGGWVLNAAIGVAILSHLDRLAISFLLPEWRTDVAGFWKARKS